MGFEREKRYLVAKLTDVRKSLTTAEQEILHVLMRKLEDGRYDNGKPTLKCVVVESDWPEYELTWQAIEDRVNAAGKQ